VLLAKGCRRIEGRDKRRMWRWMFGRKKGRGRGGGGGGGGDGSCVVGVYCVPMFQI